MHSCPPDGSRLSPAPSSSRPGGPAPDADPGRRPRVRRGGHAAHRRCDRPHGAGRRRQPDPVGNGFVVTAGDLSFILKQIKIAERHSADFVRRTRSTRPTRRTARRWSGPAPTRSRTGSRPTVCAPSTARATTSFPGRETFAAADQPFPRLTTPKFRAAEGRPQGFFGPGDPGSASSSYAQKLAGNIVYDTQPRVISNLIVDQTSTNPAAIAAAGFPVRAQGTGPTRSCSRAPRSRPRPAAQTAFRPAARPRTRRCSSRT